MNSKFDIDLTKIDIQYTLFTYYNTTKLIISLVGIISMTIMIIIGLFLSGITNNILMTVYYYLTLIINLATIFIIRYIMNKRYKHYKSEMDKILALLDNNYEEE